MTDQEAEDRLLLQQKKNKKKIRSRIRRNQQSSMRKMPKDIQISEVSVRKIVKKHTS